MRTVNLKIDNYQFGVGTQGTEISSYIVDVDCGTQGWWINGLVAIKILFLKSILRKFQI